MDDLWEEANKYSPTERHSLRGSRCTHYMVLQAGNSAECKYCHWGIYLDAFDEVRNGHLFRDDEMVI
jgi:hypothetical protein